MWKKSTSKAAPFVSVLQIHCLQGAPVCIHTCTDDAPPDPTCELPLSYNPHTHNPSQRRLDPNLLATSFQKLSALVERKKKGNLHQATIISDNNSNFQSCCNTGNITPFSYCCIVVHSYIPYKKLGNGLGLVFRGNTSSVHYSWVL